MNQVTRRNFMLTPQRPEASLGIAASRAGAGAAVRNRYRLSSRPRRRSPLDRPKRRKNSWPVAIAVVDNHGFLVAFEKMDNTQTASVQVSIDKAVSSAMYRRPDEGVSRRMAGGWLAVVGCARST